jgi:hypothetical protein
MFSERGISAVPIVDGEGRVVNLYETVDVIVRSASGPSSGSTFQNRRSTPSLFLARRSFALARTPRSI